MIFDALHLIPALLRAIAQRGYPAPTPIQNSAIPAILKGADVVAQAHPGSGKTIAFTAPVLQRWNSEKVSKPRKAFALILISNRTLAIEVGDILHQLAGYLPKPLKVAVLYGGISINPQMLHLRGGADIVVATPDRLLELVKLKALSLTDIKLLVVDELDNLCQSGFTPHISQLSELLPKARQTIVFSSAFAEPIRQISETLTHQPFRIEVANTPLGKPNLMQRAITVDMQKRLDLLCHLLSQAKWERVLVFTSSRFATEQVAMALRKKSFLAEPFHDELGQGRRNQVISDFKTHRIKVLIATDQAMKNIELPNLPVIVSYDPPRSSDEYSERNNRTGRAGTPGLVINFVCASNDHHFRNLEKSLQIQIEREQLPGFEPLLKDVSVQKLERKPESVKSKRPVPATGLRVVPKKTS